MKRNNINAIKWTESDGIETQHLIEKKNDLKKQFQQKSEKYFSSLKQENIVGCRNHEKTFANKTLLGLFCPKFCGFCDERFFAKAFNFFKIKGLAIAY